MLFLLKYIKYYHTEQIEVGPRTDLQQIGTNDMERLNYWFLHTLSENSDNTTRLASGS